MTMTNQAIETLNGNYIVSAFGCFFYAGGENLSILRTTDQQEWDWAVETWGKPFTVLPYNNEEVVKSFYEIKRNEEIALMEEEDYNYLDYDRDNNDYEDDTQMVSEPCDCELCLSRRNS